MVMKMLRFAVCDDEPHMLDGLSAQISDCLGELGRRDFRFARFSSGGALLEAGEGFDLVFLDIRMDPPDGLETARALRRRGDGCLVVFLTALREQVFDAFEVEAFDYLVKPPDPARLRRTLERALEALERRRARTLLIQRGTAREVVPLDEIAYCEVLGRKIYLHRQDGSVLDYYDKLADLERRLGSGFFRCHRSYLVNLDRVRGCGGGQVRLSGGEAVPVSRLRESDLTQALLRRMRERGG
ncbi:LytR/AlgR family response regulator transcription factor [Oscillibacter sp.]|uniref:LytR/AlgR family response regulator transcription factor n=1 Tax=Oscillibacter sp. TaxID=1945593 RepID=UPI002D8031FB|nr:LytTR family DNA-binding domain-containing protein [Oscillibacter sp.]